MDQTVSSLYPLCELNVSKKDENGSKLIIYSWLILILFFFFVNVIVFKMTKNKIKQINSLETYCVISIWIN